jgi:hypothetical protein
MLILGSVRLSRKQASYVLEFDVYVEGDVGGGSVGWEEVRELSRCRGCAYGRW